MVDYLTRAEFVRMQLELAGEKISENIIPSIVLKGLPKEYKYFKIVYDFSEDEATFAEGKRCCKISRAQEIVLWQ